MSFFIVFTNELISYFNFSIFPSFNSIVSFFQELYGKKNFYIDLNGNNPPDDCIYLTNIKGSSKNVTTIRQLLKESSRSDISFKNKTRRFIHWHIWEQFKKNSGNYDNFKKNWNPDIKIRKAISSELSKEISDKTRTLKVHKNTFKWFLGRFSGKNSDK
jgi:hypothetical protein